MRSVRATQLPIVSLVGASQWAQRHQQYSAKSLEKVFMTGRHKCIRLQHLPHLVPIIAPQASPHLGLYHTSDSIANQASSHLGSIAPQRAVSHFKRKNDHKDRRWPRCKLGQWWTFLNLIRSANTFTDNRNSIGIPKVVLVVVAFGKYEWSEKMRQQLNF